MERIEMSTNAQYFLGIEAHQVTLFRSYEAQIIAMGHLHLRSENKSDHSGWFHNPRLVAYSLRPFKAQTIYDGIGRVV